MNASHQCDKMLKHEHVILGLITEGIVYKRMTANYFVLFHYDKFLDWIIFPVLYMIKTYADKLERV